MKPIDFNDLGAHLHGEPRDDWDTDAAWQRMQMRMQPRRRIPFAAIAALLVVALGIGVTWVQRQAQEASSNATPVAATYRTSVGERRTVSLADGSSVELAALSVLRVITLNEQQRIVALEGQAFFDVAHDEQRPFVVRARDSETRVLGTSFDVNAYDGAAGVEVIVASGRVRLSGHGNAAVLTPGQAGLLDAAGVAVRAVDVEEAMAWRSGRLSFRDARLADVAVVLERWYGVQIVVADVALAQARVTAFLPQQSLADVLDVLAETLNARHERTGTRITFYAK